LKETNGVHVTSDSERAELLNNYFCSVCTHDDGISPGYVCDKRAADTCIDCVTFSRANIQRAMNKLKAYLARGIDGFLPLLVNKISAKSITAILVVI